MGQGVTGPGAATEPAGTAALQGRVREAAAAGGRLAPRGAGTWWPMSDSRPLDVLSLEPVVRVDAGDLVATAAASCRLDVLGASLQERGAWLALDPPGSTQRTLGSVLAAGGAGPLAARFGPPRDQVLGLSVLCGNGTVARCGGRVVKNVAGFDLAKVVVGGHGGFGVVLQAHLRLRARPDGDATIGGLGSRAEVVAAAGALMRQGLTPAAFEVVSPLLARELGLVEEWALLARSMGAGAGVADETTDIIARLRGAGLEELRPGPDVWQRWSVAMGAPPLSVRIGAAPAEWPEAAALAERHLGTRVRLSVTVPRGTVRAAGDASAAAVRDLRREAAARGWPVTLERAARELLAVVGVWGCLRGGVASLAHGLRATFDPDGVFDVPLWGERA